MRAGGRGGAPGVVRAWRGARGATWCTKSRQPLYLRFLCTKSHAFLRPWPAPTWCTKSRRPLFFRFLCTKSHAFLCPLPAPTWCTKSRRPLYLRSLCTKSHAFLCPWPAPAWCTKSRESLYLRSLCTNSPAFLHPWPGGRGASPLAIPRYPLFLRPEAPRLRAQTKSDAPRLPPSCITFPLLYFQRERIDDEHHPPSFRRQF